MTRERRKWTAEEDALLRGAVEAAIEESRPLLWRELAKSVPDRTNKDCRRRWCNTLNGAASKGPWTESEDERLWNAIQKHGSKWTRVAAAVGTRNSDQCSSHWNQTLNPGINYSDWTSDEDERLLNAVQRYGTNWKTIALTELPSRTTLALKNRYSALRMKSSQFRSKSDVKSKRSSRRVATKNSSNHSRSVAASNNRGNNDQYCSDEDDDDDDEDEDEEDEDDEDDDEDQDSENDGNREENLGQAIDSANLLQMELNEGLPANKKYCIPRGHTSAHRAPVQFSQLSSQDQNGTQQTDYNSASTAVEQTNADPKQPAALPNGFSFPPTPDYSQKSPHSMLPGISRGLPSGEYNQHRQHPLCEHHATQPNLSTNASLTPLSFDVFPTASDQLMPHNLQQLDHHFLHFPTLARENEAGSSTQDKMRAEQQQFGQPILDTGASNCYLGPHLQRVSIDVVCTPDQLGHITSALVGLSKSITVKVESSSERQ